MSKENGKFEKGNTIGAETRFKPGNRISSKYSAKYCDMMLAYFRENMQMFPTFELFADSIGVTIQTLNNWKEKYPRFLTAYEQCLTIQKGKLIVGGLSGLYNSTIAKFVAVNNHGMKDKVETESSQKEPFEVRINVVKPS